MSYCIPASIEKVADCRWHIKTCGIVVAKWGDSWDSKLPYFAWVENGGGCLGGEFDTLEKARHFVISSLAGVDVR